MSITRAEMEHDSDAEGGGKIEICLLVKILLYFYTLTVRGNL